MKCPTCPDQTLMMTERIGIEIDYCPACRGVWLDRGELDRIIERSTESSPAAPAAPPMPSPMPVATPSPAMPTPMPTHTGTAPAPQGYERPRWYDDDDDRRSRSRDDSDRYDRPRYDGDRYDSDRYDPRSGKPYKKKKAKNLFEELFDF